MNIQEKEQTLNSSKRNVLNDEILKQKNNHFEKLSQLHEELLNTLLKAIDNDNPNSTLGKECARIHKERVTLCWGYYSRQAHINLCNMYVEDKRLRKFYDARREGLAEFLRDAVINYNEE